MFIEKRRNRKKPWLIAVCAILGIGFCIYWYRDVQGASSGMVTPTSTPTPRPLIVLPTLTPGQAQPTPQPTPSNRLEEGADVVLTYHHTRCTHEKSLQLTEETLVGMDRETLAAAYPKAKVTEFSTGRARLTETVDQYCPDHYLLQYKDGDLKIYRPQLGRIDWVLADTVADVYLPYPDAALEQGIVFDTPGALEGYLENFDE